MIARGVSRLGSSIRRTRGLRTRVCTFALAFRAALDATTHAAMATEFIHLHAAIEMVSLSPLRHPGKVLREDFLKERRITVAMLAKQTGIGAWYICNLTRGTRAITADTAFRLAQALDTSALYWMLLQGLYDLAVEQRLRDTGARGK